MYDPISFTFTLIFGYVIIQIYQCIIMKSQNFVFRSNLINSYNQTFAAKIKFRLKLLNYIYNLLGYDNLMLYNIFLSACMAWYLRN